MARLKIEKKIEYFITCGTTQEADTFLVRDSSGSLLFVFREHFIEGWKMTSEEPYGFCCGAQEAPEKAEFPRASFPALQILEEAFNKSRADFLEAFQGLGISFLRRVKAEEEARQAQVEQKQAREEAELKKLRDEFDHAPLRDRADLSGLNQSHLKDLSLEWEWESPYIDQTRLVLRQAGDIRAHFWVSKERRRAEFNVSGGWDPMAYSAEEIPQRGLRIPVLRALKYLEERISQILPPPRLPKEISGRKFTGKGMEFWLSRMRVEPFGLDDACMASYGAGALQLREDWEKVWDVEDLLDQAWKIHRARHRVRNGFYVWRVSQAAKDQARRDGKNTMGYYV